MSSRIAAIFLLCEFVHSSQNRRNPFAPVWLILFYTLGDTVQKIGNTFAVLLGDKMPLLYIALALADCFHHRGRRHYVLGFLYGVILVQ